MRRLVLKDLMTLVGERRQLRRERMVWAWVAGCPPDRELPMPLVAEHRQLHKRGMVTMVPGSTIIQGFLLGYDVNT